MTDQPQPYEGDTGSDRPHDKERWRQVDEDAVEGEYPALGQRQRRWDVNGGDGEAQPPQPPPG